jgi:hypothetical protein
LTPIHHTPTTFDDPESKTAIPSKSGDYRPKFSWSIALATTFSPRFTIVSPRFHQSVFRFRRLPIAKDIRRKAEQSQRTNLKLTTTHHKPRSRVLSIAKWSVHNY